MKHFTLLCTMLLFSVTLMAQPPQNRQGGQGGQGGQRAGMERNGNFQLFQMQMIIKQLAIEEDKQEEFSTIYTQYTEQMQLTQPRHQREQNREANGQGREKLTDEQIEQQILDSFTSAEKVTALKKEYYYKFKEILSPQQIMRMYKIEREISERINSEIQNRAGAGGNRPPQGNRQ